MSLQPTHHEPTPSVAALRKKGRVSQRKDKPKEEFQHPDKPSMYALDEAKRVEIGRKYWEQKEQWEPMNSVDWRDLKAAKDFELGMGNSLYRHGTLSTWTDEQIQVLQREMENTLALTGDDEPDDPSEASGRSGGKNDAAGGAGGTGGTKQNSLDRPGRHKTSLENASVATVLINDDVSISLSHEAASMLSAQINQSYEHLPYSPSGGYGDEEESMSFVDNIGKKGKKGRKGKKTGQPTHSAQGTDLALLDMAQEIERQKQKQASQGPNYNDKEDSSLNVTKEMAGHRRTRTEALRLKLSDMEKRLKFVQEDLTKANDEIDAKSQDLQKAESRLEQDQRVKEQNAKMQNEMSALTGALKSAQQELAQAEAQISRKDQENANLQRELSICKQLNRELAGKAEDGKGLTADDLLNTRIADAKRFAYMLTAMQEQLEFEREAFTKRLHIMEQQMEHKDVQLTALYQLYNKLVAKTEKKGWFSRWLDKDEEQPKQVTLSKQQNPQQAQQAQQAQQGQRRRTSSAKGK